MEYPNILTTIFGVYAPAIPEYDPSVAGGWLLETDEAPFVQAVRLFAECYQEPGVLRVQIGRSASPDHILFLVKLWHADAADPQIVANLLVYPADAGIRLVVPPCLTRGASFVRALVAWCLQRWRAVTMDAEVLPAAQPARAKRESGPTARTEMRFEVFRRLKAEHPTWSQARVAQVACDELGESVTEFTVKNTYNAMGARWERGDRVRNR